MKIRESGTPEEDLWMTFFTSEEVLRALGASSSGEIVDFGRGHGTFTIPAARITSGAIHALDIDPEMVAITTRKAKAAGLGNVRACLRDFVAEGTGLPEARVHYVMLFNILHAERPDLLLCE
jgi:ubiquinone/menaquinone biosynthesis C-methylase UbiE